MATDTQPLYLEKVKLSGYKSIENVEVDFMPGLNIIIGKNAAGKTNFLEFLNRSLEADFKGLISFDSNLGFNVSNNEVLMKSYSSYDKKDLAKDLFNPKTNTLVFLNNKQITSEKNINDNYIKDLQSANVEFSKIFIQHGIPKKYFLVDTPISFTATKASLNNELLIMLQKPYESQFAWNISFALFVFSLDFHNKAIPFNSEFINNKILEIFKRLENLKELLKLYSPINDVRLNENFNVFVSEDLQSYTVSNLFLEFNVSGSWLPFSSLSDGTKRIFYILSETYYFNTHEDTETNERNKSIYQIILIEEPELGVHPHQFKRIMDFLKEQSKTKQIIISTHSPQALNVLGKDDLNRIIIAYATPDGTKLRHLDEQEIDKAKAYIDEVFLSDYWLYSDLEKDTIS